jgi:hypothetical protein
MNRVLRAIAVAAIAVCANFHVHSQGYIVPNGVAYVGFNWAGGYEIDVIRDPTNSYTTGFWFTPRGTTPPSDYPNTFEFDPIPDVGVRVFLVGENQPISLQAILANSYTELLYPNDYVFADNVPFYLGLYTGNQSFAPPDGIYSDPLFGWAWVMNNHGAIQLLDGVLAYGSQGIYAGTLDLIPEPSVPSLLGLGLLGLGWHLRRKLAHERERPVRETRI